MSSEVGRWQGYQVVRHNVAVTQHPTPPMFSNSAGLLSVQVSCAKPVSRAIGGAETGAQNE